MEMTQFSKKISLITQPGKKDKGLLEICRANTEFASKRNNSDLDIDIKIASLKAELKINADIRVIESYDISHHSGDYAVAGCVVYTNEGKAKNMYRSYNIIGMLFHCKKEKEQNYLWIHL